MPSFSSRSASKLASCHDDLNVIFNEVVKYRDCTILEGVRTLERQRDLFDTGKSKTMNSKHLRNSDGVSMAVDVAVYPIDWNNRERFILFAGFVLGVATRLKAEGKITHKLVSGIDWNSDGNLKDTSFFDAPHFQLEP